nr:MAG TPA: hypothetical protein [Caudoviricetes sp.]DAY57839.1 MAG TPA: hypothetical protein [Caudoviricetes sp.]
MFIRYTSTYSIRHFCRNVNRFADKKTDYFI